MHSLVLKIFCVGPWLGWLPALDSDLQVDWLPAIYSDLKLIWLPAFLTQTWLAACPGLGPQHSLTTRSGFWPSLGWLLILNSDPCFADFALYILISDLADYSLWILTLAWLTTHYWFWPQAWLTSLSGLWCVVLIILCVFIAIFLFIVFCNKHFSFIWISVLGTLCQG